MYKRQVGVSFGADRIYDVLNGLGLYPADLLSSTKVLFVNFGGVESLKALEAVRAVRAAGVAADFYPDAAKLKKQMKYADDLAIPYVAIIGETEAHDGTITLKHMATGEQTTLPLEEAIAKLRG